MNTSNDGELHSQSTKLGRPLQFVAVYPNARKRWLGSPRVVRSNAAQHQWKEFKEAKPRGRKSKVLPQLVERVNNTRSNIDPNQSECVRIDGASYADLALSENAQPLSAGWEGTGDALDHPRSINALSYRPYPSTLPSEIVGSLFHFVCQLAPQVCGVGSNSTAPVEMIRQLLSHPGTFHGCLFAAASLQDELRPSPLLRSRSYRAVIEACRMIAITSAKSLISNINSTSKTNKTNDIQLLISMVTALSTQPQVDEILRKPVLLLGPRQAPFRKLDALDQLGSGKRYQNIHMNAAITLIELAGGIDAVPEFHRVTNSALAIIVATRLQSKPQLPCRVSNPDFEEIFSLFPTDIWTEITASAANLVCTVAEFGPTLSERLLPVITNLCLCVHITDSLLHRRNLRMQPSDLIDARKWTQHRLLSLPTSSELATAEGWPSQQLKIYEVLRLGMNIFSLIAVYPLPLSAAPFVTLATKLGLLLESNPIDNMGHRRLHLWASTMGALAAIGTPRRAFFVDLVARDVQSLRLHSWAPLEATLQGFLWYADVSEFDGQYLWLEVQQKLKLQARFEDREVSGQSMVL